VFAVFVRAERYSATRLRICCAILCLIPACVNVVDQHVGIEKMPAAPSIGRRSEFDNLADSYARSIRLFTIKLVSGWQGTLNLSISPMHVYAARREKPQFLASGISSISSLPQSSALPPKRQAVAPPDYFPFATFTALTPDIHLSLYIHSLQVRSSLRLAHAGLESARRLTMVWNSVRITLCSGGKLTFAHAAAKPAFQPTKPPSS